VASLDERLNLDPFSGDSNIDLPVTVGDLIELYENAAV
jgi:fructose-1,6-bisphosphatase